MVELKRWLMKARTMYSRQSVCMIVMVTIIFTVAIMAVGILCVVLFFEGEDDGLLCKMEEKIKEYVGNLEN